MLVTVFAWIRASLFCKLHLPFPDTEQLFPVRSRKVFVCTDFCQQIYPPKQATHVNFPALIGELWALQDTFLLVFFVSFIGTCLRDGANKDLLMPSIMAINQDSIASLTEVWKKAADVINFALGESSSITPFWQLLPIPSSINTKVMSSPVGTQEKTSPPWVLMWKVAFTPCIVESWPVKNTGVVVTILQAGVQEKLLLAWKIGVGVSVSRGRCWNADMPQNILVLRWTKKEHQMGFHGAYCGHPIKSKFRKSLGTSFPQSLERRWLLKGLIRALITTHGKKLRFLQTSLLSSFRGCEGQKTWFSSWKAPAATPPRALARYYLKPFKQTLHE